jgi:hypothetical protein
MGNRRYKNGRSLGLDVKKRFKVLTAASMKMTAFWDIAPCSLIEVDRRFRGAYCVHHQGDDGGSKHL